ncbi:uncharacterized sporulation protein YeaH/YhbH (DUF444 family) [Bradyrhizobium sp. USDA 4341]
MQFIDRRLNPGGKSLENRQRFLRRAKETVRDAVRKASQDRNIKDVLEGGEVTISIGGMDEPRFHREGGVRDMVLPGNSKFVEGDYLPRQGNGGTGQGRNAAEGTAEDAFRFVLTREEFLDLFLDDLELPDLAKRALAEAEAERPQRAGYSTSGSPANISIGRTVRRAMTRRIALGRPSKERMTELETAIASETDDERRSVLIDEVEALRAKVHRIPFIDPIDIRYRRFDCVPRPASQAVMFCMMDVSASMSETMKDLAKRFYMLLYVFLTRKYKRVEIVFIRHTDTAEEVDEKTFFYDPKTGGTKVSPALATMAEIVKKRFAAPEWNIYVAQASDGDTGFSESGEITKLVKDVVLPTVQYFAYLEVGHPDAGHYMHGDYSTETALWGLYARLVEGGAPLAMRKVTQRSDIFPVFRDLFQRREMERAG